MENDEVFVRITNREIYTAIQGLQRDMDTVKQTVSVVPDTRRRLKSLELKVLWALSGLTLALIALGGAVLKGLVTNG